MAALRDFDRRGGLIGMGDDAGFIYQMYGFGLIRSMELHQEAGFHPIKIIQQATGNNAKILGQEDKLGRVRAGFTADLIVVNGNPLENLKVLYPTGIEEIRNGRQVHGGGVEWTIKDGIPVPCAYADGTRQRDRGPGAQEVTTLRTCDEPAITRPSPQRDLRCAYLPLSCGTMQLAVAVAVFPARSATLAVRL